MQQGISAEAKAAMVDNLQLEINARKEKLRAQSEAQCASLQSRLERRINRIPATKRSMPLVDLLSASLPSHAAPIKAAPAKKAPEPKAPVVPAPGPARKTRTATTLSTTLKSIPHIEEPKLVSRPVGTRTTAKPKTVKETKTSRARKRGSDKMQSEDKENAAELAVPKKRTKIAAPKTAAIVKPAATRATRATSRTKAIPAQILSPKNDNANAQSKPIARNTRQR